MRLLTRSLTCVLLLVVLSPFIASAAGLSFGGRVVAVLPCLSPLGPSIWFSIVPSGVFPPAYIWTPVTLTFLSGPPTHPGQQVLGLYDTPFVCEVGFVPLAGMRVQLMGSSAL